MVCNERWPGRVRRPNEICTSSDVFMAGGYNLTGATQSGKFRHASEITAPAVSKPIVAVRGRLKNGAKPAAANRSAAGQLGGSMLCRPVTMVG